MPESSWTLCWVLVSAKLLFFCCSVTYFTQISIRFNILACFKRHLFESQIISNRLGNDDWHISPSFRRHNKCCLFKHWIKTLVAALLLCLYFDLQTGTTWQAQIRNIKIRYLKRSWGAHFGDKKILYAESCLFRNFNRRWVMSSSKQLSHSLNKHIHTNTPLLFYLLHRLSLHTWTVLLALICSWWRRSHCWVCWYCERN